MSILTAFGVRERRTTVTIAWPGAAPSNRVTATKEGEHGELGIAPGAGVLTLRGTVPAADLVPGDIVMDGQGGSAPLVASIRVPADLGTERVTIAPCALGGGLPAAPLVLGSKSRLAVTSEIARRLVGRPDVLVPVEALLHLDGVSRDPAGLDDCIHLVFEAHAIAAVDSVRVEALVPSAGFIESLPHKQSAALCLALPKLRYDWAFAAYLTDMPELDAREARQVLPAKGAYGGNRGASAQPSMPPATACQEISRQTVAPRAQAAV